MKNIEKSEITNTQDYQMSHTFLHLQTTIVKDQDG